MRQARRARRPFLDGGLSSSTSLAGPGRRSHRLLCSASSFYFCQAGTEYGAPGACCLLLFCWTGATCPIFTLPRTRDGQTGTLQTLDHVARRSGTKEPVRPPLPSDHSSVSLLLSTTSSSSSSSRLVIHGSAVLCAPFAAIRGPSLPTGPPSFGPPHKPSRVEKRSLLLVRPEPPSRLKHSTAPPQTSTASFAGMN